jgi:hypothetical protein
MSEKDFTTKIELTKRFLLWSIRKQIYLYKELPGVTKEVIAKTFGTIADPDDTFILYPDGSVIEVTPGAYIVNTEDYCESFDTLIEAEQFLWTVYSEQATKEV